MRWRLSASHKKFTYRSLTDKHLKSRSARPWLLLVIVLLIFFIIGTIRGIERRLRVNKELTALQQQIQFYEQENVKLDNLLNYLSSDTFVAMEARRQLGLGKTGEQPIVVVPSNATSNNNVASKTGVVKLPSNLQLWWDYFFKPQ